MTDRAEQAEGRGRTPSVRLRILTAVLLTTALGMAVAGGISYAIARNQVRAEVYQSLHQEVEELKASTKVAADPETGLPIRTLSDVLTYAIKATYPDSDEAVLGIIDGKVKLVPDSDNHALQQSVQKDRQFVAAAEAVRPGDSPGVYRASTTMHGDLAYISVPVQVTGRPQVGHYVTAINMETAFDAVNGNYLAFAGVCAASLLLIGAVGYAVSGQLLAPLRSLRRTAQRISETDLTDRIPEDQLSSRDEVADLGRTMNAMLGRLAFSFETQRQFLDDVGHELRTPVTIVRGHLELMDHSDPTDVAETRALALDELDRMQRLVDDLMLLAKTRRPDFVRLAPTPVDELLVSVLDKIALLGHRKWSIDASPEAVVPLDQQRMSQALLQLVSNALRFTEDGDVIALGGRITGSEVRLWVRDEGAGIAPDEQKLIFERHHSLPGAVDDHPHGAGLGLAIVSAIAEAHHGRVELESRPGYGSSFSLVMPGANAQVIGDSVDPETVDTATVAIESAVVATGPTDDGATDKAATEKRVIENGDTELGGQDMATILIAEDEARIAAFVEKGLRAAGYNSTIVGTGPDALAQARSGNFDLMILDIGLPQLDGFSVLEAMRGQGSQLPVIILTARDSVTDTVAGLEGGANDYMGKPFRFEELLARVRLRLRDQGTGGDAVLTVGDLSLDLRTRIVQVEDKPKELSAREFSLLETFMRHPGQVLSREQLLSHVWGFQFDPGSNVVDVYVRYLRHKVGTERIQTVRGAGYRLTLG